MLPTLIRKEILESLLSAKFIVTFLVVTALTLSGLIIGSRNFNEQIGDVERQQDLNRRMLSSQFDWVTAGFVGVFETKRPYVLSIFDGGVENSLGRQANISTFRDSRLDESRNTVSPILAVFGDVDISFVVRIVLSLFAVMLSFNAVCGERESGTLKLSLSNPVPRYKILLAKVVGGLSVLAGAFIVPMLLGLLYMQVFQPGIMALFTGTTWLRLMLIFVIYLLFLSVIFAVGLFVSAVSHGSSTSFIFMLMFWILFITILPGISMTAAERLRPSESYATIQAKAVREINQKRSVLLNEFLRTWMQSLADGSFSRKRADFASRLTNMGQEVLDRYNRDYDLGQNAQISLARNIARLLSPTSAMSFSVQQLAGSGWDRQQEYLNQLRKFRHDFVGYINEEIEKESDISLVELLQGKELDINPERITFRFREESLERILYRVLPDMMILLVEVLIFFALAHFAFQRYDIR